MKLITVGDERYVVLGTALADCDYSNNKLKSMYGLADAVLRNGDTLYICMTIINAEFEDLIIGNLVESKNKKTEIKN